MQNDGKQLYIEWIQHQKDALLFHQPWWLNTVFGENWHIILLHDIDGKIVDALPYNIDKKWVFTLIRYHPIIPYMPNVKYRNTQNYVRLQGLLPKYDFLQSLPHFDSAKLNQKAFCEEKQRVTNIKDIKNVTDIHLTYSQQARRHLKKAYAKLTIVENKWNTSWFVLNHRKSYENKNKLYPYSLPFIDKLIHNSIDNKSVYITQAYLQDRLVAQMACFYDQHTMYYLLGAKDDDYNVYNAMTLLIHQSIIKAQELGLQYFDFEGSSDKGIQKFFEKFHPNKKVYYSYEHSPSVLWRLKVKFLN